MAWPTLTRGYLSLDITPENNVIASPLEAGYEHRRPRFTRSRRNLTVKFDLLDDTDKEAMVTFLDSVGLHSSFTFTDNDENDYTVFITDPVGYQRVVPGWWQFTDIKMREV